MEEKMIKVARYRKLPYKVNYINNGMKVPYVWSGSKGNFVDVKEIPERVVNYLLMSTSCFKKGDLRIIEDKELESNIDDKEQYENNTHTRDDIEKLLNGNFMKMKSELNKITVKEEKQFVVDIAKELNIDSSAKREFIADWMGVAQDILFGKYEE